MMKDHNPAVEFDLRKYYPEQYQRIITIRREKMYHNILVNLKKGKEEGLYRQEMDEVIIAKLQMLRVENTFDTTLFTTEELTNAKAFREIFIYHMRGIASKKGLQMLEEKIVELEKE